MFALLARSVSAQAEIAPPDLPLPLFHSQSRQYLLGDWKGKRSALAEKGVTFDFFYISDMLANPSGGLEQTQGGWKRIRGTIDINVDRLMQWQGLRFHATGLWQSGVNLGGKVGTLASPSDLVSAHTTRLDSFWLEQNLGTRFNAPFARRNKDRVACAFVYSKISDPFRDFGEFWAHLVSVPKKHLN